MNVGFACLSIGVYHNDYKTIRKDNLTDSKLIEIIKYNLESLSHIIDYNIKNNLKLFRISSDVIPFGSSPFNQLEWWIIFKDKFKELSRKIKDNQIRVSMHPGQYTVLNSPNEEVVDRSIEDLIYHAKVLDYLETKSTSKIILHIGGVYGDKQSAMKRFLNNYQRLPQNVKDRLIIENDDRSYNIADVLEISRSLNIPVVFDNLHHKINPPNVQKTDQEWINLCRLTFKEKDGTQKIHYSEQDPLKQPGAHSKTINPNTFLDYYHLLNRDDIDIMLEVKDKNVSAVKIKDCTNKNLKAKDLESSWAKYKYSILEYSPNTYFQIRELLKDKTNLDPLHFYNRIDNALNEPLLLNNQINAIDHVWGYFKTDLIEKENYLKKLDKLKKGSLSVKSMKKYLFNLAVKNNITYLLESYYFDLV